MKMRPPARVPRFSPYARTKKRLEKGSKDVRMTGPCFHRADCTALASYSSPVYRCRDRGACLHRSDTSGNCHSLPPPPTMVAVVYWFRKVRACSSVLLPPRSFQPPSDPRRCACTTTPR